MGLKEQWRWLFSMLTPYRLVVIPGAILVALTVIANIGLMATSAVLLSWAALMPPILWLMPLITGVRFFGIFRAVLRYAERLLNHSIAFRILGGLRVRLYQKLERVVPDRLMYYTEGMFYNKLIADIEVLKYFYLKAVSVPVGAVLVIVACAVFMQYYDRQAALLMTAAMLISALVIPIALRRLGAAARRDTAATRAALSDDVVDYVQGMGDLIMYQGVDEARGKLHQQVQRVGTLAVQQGALGVAAAKSVGVISHLTFLGVLMLAVPKVHSDMMQGVYLAMLGMAALAAFEAVQGMPEAVEQVDDSLAVAKTMVPLMETEEEAPVADAPEISSRPEIRMNNVRFSFHDPTRQFIDDLNMVIPYGTKVAFIGVSGSGKSTVARLINRLWTVDGGDVTLGGVPYSRLDRDHVGKYIGTLEQTPYFFHATVAENLRLACPTADDAALWDVLDAVQLRDVVEAMPEGLRTRLAANGSGLSGGQRQRLGMARLLLEDAPILILDEPTQNLDPRQGAALLEMLLARAADKTVILITHHMAPSVGMDFIYLFEHGKIREQGSPEVLLQQRDSLYHRLVMLEKSHF